MNTYGTCKCVVSIVWRLVASPPRLERCTEQVWFGKGNAVLSLLATRFGKSRGTKFGFAFAYAQTFEGGSGISLRWLRAFRNDE
jgi:hypothetical protein